DSALPGGAAARRAARRSPRSAADGRGRGGNGAGGRRARQRRVRCHRRPAAHRAVHGRAGQSGAWGPELYMTRNVFLLLFAAALSACTPATPEQQIVNDAAAAIGGRDKIAAVKTLVLEGDGRNGNLGQDLTPEATKEAFIVTSYRRAIDLAGHRARTEQTRT